MGRGAALGGNTVGRKPMDRARRGAGLDGVDHDRPIEADHPLHQPEPAPIVLGDFDVVPIGQPGFQLLNYPQPDAVVSNQGIAEAEDESFHRSTSRGTWLGSFLDVAPSRRVRQPREYVVSADLARNPGWLRQRFPHC